VAEQTRHLSFHRWIHLDDFLASILSLLPIAILLWLSSTSAGHFW